jgi:hypothetical protein
VEKIDFTKYKLADTLATQRGRKEQNTFQVRKPKKDEWWMTHPSSDMVIGPLAAIQTADLAWYLVDPQIVPRLKEVDYELVTLHVAITHSASIFLLPVKFGSNGFSDSLRAAVEASKAGFVRIAANMADKMYDAYMPTNDITPPVWPDDITLTKVLEVAFKGRAVDAMNHPVLKELRGEF